MTTEPSEPMSTRTAQRRLLEALAGLENNTYGGLPGMRLGMPLAIAVAEQDGQMALAEVWRALDDLAASVYDDMKETTRD